MKSASRFAQLIWSLDFIKKEVTMYTILALLIGVVIGIVISAIYCFIKRNRKSTAKYVEEQIQSPLPLKKYEDLLEKINNRYHNSMSQYDKLVPWAAGGGLVVSLGFVSSIASMADENTKWIIGAAWFCLVLSLLSSIISQYISTRISVWAKKYVIARQSPPLKSAKQVEKENWHNLVLTYKNRSDKNGIYTKWLNVTAGIFLTVGLLFLGVFALCGVKFGNN
jgi:uncharacterized membrane protein